MGGKFKTQKKLGVTAACLLSALPAYAQTDQTISDETGLISAFGLALASFAAGYFLNRFSTKNRNDPTIQSRKYLAALEKISQGFSFFLKDPEKSIPDTAIEWLLEETAKAIEVERASVWLCKDDLQSLVQTYLFDERASYPAEKGKLTKRHNQAFFGTLRGERTLGFDQAKTDIRCHDYIEAFAEENQPNSLLIAVIGVGSQTFGTLNISSLKKPRIWHESDHQFIASIADLVAFYMSSRNLHIAQNALKASDKRFRDLVDASSDWFWETGPNHRFTYISNRFTTMTGVAKEHLLGTTRHDFTNLKSLTENARRHYETLESHRPFRNYHYKFNLTGKELILSINGKPFFDENGTFKGYLGTGSNITESTAQRKRFEEGINALPNGFIMWDANDRLVMWNNTILEFFAPIAHLAPHKTTYREFLEISFKKGLIKEPEGFDSSMIEELTLTHLKCGQREVELTDGRYLLIHEHPTSEGGIVSIYTDVSPLKKREEELIETNRFSKALSHCVNTIVHARNESFILAETLRAITEMDEFDSAWVSLFNTIGSLPDRLNITMEKGVELGLETLKTSSTLKQAFIKQDRFILKRPVLEQALPDLKDHIDKEGIKSGALLPIHMDTKIIGFLFVLSRSQKEFKDNHVDFLAEIANDISYGISSLRSEKSRMITEEALRESEARYRSLVDMSPDAILVLNQDHKVVFANPEGHALFATKTRTDILEKDFNNFVCDELNLFENAPTLEDEQPLLILSSIRLRRFDDTIFDADITSRPVSYGGLETRLLIIRDVTERNQVNEHLAQTSKLATLGEMAAGITHELSQPLNIMRFAAEGSLLKIQRDDMDIERIQKQFDLISIQCARMADIIDHMRVFSRKDTGGIETFDPALVVRQSVDLIEAQYYAEDIHLEVRYPAYYEMVKGRPIQLEQVILNLITNARDAINQRSQNTPDDVPKVKRIDVTMTFDQADHKINIAISDNGGGIPEEALAKLFDPFFTTKEVGKGTGLGLSVSYGIIAAMGGTIRARNIHKGARFDISIPCVETDDDFLIYNRPKTQINLDDLPDDDEDLDIDIDPNGISVLVVDDEVYAAEAMMEYLFSCGYQVNMAGDGEEALELFDSEPVDVVVTDVRMPRMDGYILTKQLKQRNPDLPVIVVTGHTGMDDTNLNDLNTQAFKVLKKPVSLSDLGKTVEQAAQTIK